MYQYYDTNDNRKGKFIATLCALSYIVLWVVLMFVVKFHLMQNPPVSDQGIMINFGDVESAVGEQDTPISDQIAQPEHPQTQTQENIITADNGDIEVAKPKPITVKPKPEAAIEKPREADKRAMFTPGRTAGSASTSEGAVSGSGNQGNLSGTTDGSHSGTGMGTAGTAFNLAGRSTAGSLPKPDYNGNREGRVVIQIVVNAAGNVVSASFSAQGSTTNDGGLIADALSAARKARFNVVEATDNQTGTITYIFKMK